MSYYSANRDEILKRRKEYYERNKEKYREIYREYHIFKKKELKRGQRKIMRKIKIERENIMKEKKRN